MSTSSLTDSQLKALTVTERVNSCVAVVSILFILVTYTCSPHFNKPINRLIFFASWGNLGSDIAAIISDYGIRAGSGHPLCQFQAFMVQMFLGVDALYALCMAINVYLAFFHNYSIKQFRSLDIKYLLFCYGISLIPALTFLFVKNRYARVYGPATLWCWIDVEWDILRILVLYLWVWVAIVFALAVYIRAGITLYHRRKQLRGFLNPLNEHPFAALTVTTEIHVTSQPAEVVPDGQKAGEAAMFSEPMALAANLDNSPYRTQTNVQHDGSGNQSSFNKPAIMRVRTLTREVAQEALNPDACLYARVAFLFYLALLVTWVPSSVNRVYSLLYPQTVNFGMNYASAFVLPLQGFWNVVIYIITSRTACRRLWYDIRHPSARRRGQDPANTPDPRTQLYGIESRRNHRSKSKRLGSVDDMMTLTDMPSSEV